MSINKKEILFKPIDKLERFSRIANQENTRPYISLRSFVAWNICSEIDIEAYFPSQSFCDVFIFAPSLSYFAFYIYQAICKCFPRKWASKRSPSSLPACSSRYDVSIPRKCEECQQGISASNHFSFSFSIGVKSFSRGYQALLWQ